MKTFTSDFFVKCGREGGLKGGKARAKKLSARRRRQIAKIAVAAREAKREKKKNGED